VLEALRRMTRWRVALGVLLGLLLPMPLVLLLKNVVQVGPGAFPPSDRPVSPVLEFEERLSRVTYQRECHKGSDCEAPLGCLHDRRTRTRYCIDSECTANEQCPEGQTCQALPTLDEGPLVRYCIPLGLRQEGEECFRPPSDKEYACGAGLVCAGMEGWCGRPCSAEAAPCLQGFFCADVAPQAVCLPTCEKGGCPAGQKCVLYKEGVSRCAIVYGTNCQQSPCSEGRACEVFDVARQPDKVWMECVRNCGEGSLACPAGLACDVTRCRVTCDPQVPSICGEGYRCEKSKPDSPWVCQPDW
jgi:hypothetical protein